MPGWVRCNLCNFEGRIEDALEGENTVKTDTEIRIDKIELKTATTEDAARGLLGFLSFRVNKALQLSGIALRRTRGGRPILSFPAKQDAHGQQHFFIRPLDDETREEIEYQVFSALGIQ